VTELTRRALIGGSLALVAAQARSQAAWPEQPITIVHGFAAGGGIDIVARIIAEGLSKRLGQRVLVEAKPGATGTIAAAQVARAVPDGHTLLAIASGHAVTAATFKALPYRPVDDFETISITADYPLVMVTHAEHPAKSLGDFLIAARAPGKPVLYGTPGNGSFQHLAVELFARTAGIELQQVPYRGSAQALTDLLGKRLDLIMDAPPALLPAIRDGRLRALAVTGPRRFFLLPEVPTVEESGVRGYSVTSWQGLVAPAGIPAHILERLNSEVTSVLTEPAVIERFKGLGSDARPTSAAEFKAKVSAEIEKWSSLVVSANIERI
jgi:tripartite-type tricarboxylate transporter receptor subunit TctC